jgi:hypothetical protein
LSSSYNTSHGPNQFIFQVFVKFQKLKVQDLYNYIHKIVCSFFDVGLLS